MIDRRRALRASIALLAAWLPTAPVAAQDFPNRPITLVAPFPAGSVTDSVSRVVAQGMQDALGHGVVVENRAGAQGTVGAAYVARAKPDGHTLLVASSGMFVAGSFYKNLSYDPNDAFLPVAGVGSTSMMFMVQHASPLRSIGDLTRAVQSGGAPVTIGFGSPTGQLALAMYSGTAKVAPVPVAYRGIPQAMTDLSGGHVGVAIVDVGTGLAQVAAGRARALAISAASRHPGAPDVPTLDEVFPNASVSLETLIAIVAPAGTPAPVVERLDAAIRSALAKPETRAKFDALSTSVTPLSSRELAQRLRLDTPKWEALIQRAGIERE